MLERRKVHRNRTLLGGEVSYSRQYSPFRCVVRDLSEVGARLHFSASQIIPAELDLTIATHARTRRARVVWREGDAAGVAFAAPDQDRAPIPLDLMRRLRASEGENRALRERLAAPPDPA